MRRLLTALTLILLALGFFAIGYYSILNSPPKSSTIDAEVTPRDSSIKIDGQKASFGDNKVTKGQHTIVVSKEGFKSQTQTVSLTIGQSSYIGVILQPDSSQTKNWYQTHSGDQSLSGAISSHLSDHQSAAAVTENPILQVLPITFGNGYGGFITISSGTPVAGSNQPSITVIAQSPADRQTAVEWIRSHGYDTSTMDIVFESEVDGFLIGSKQ